MKRIFQKSAVVVILLAFILASCSSSPKVDWTLTISGDVGEILEVSYSDLVDMPQTDLSDILMNKSVGEDEITSWSGVLLEYLLEQTGTDAEFSTATAIAADGYAIEITRSELKNAIVALKKSGEWIWKEDPEHGPIRLVAPETPANRWIFQLLEIQINK